MKIDLDALRVSLDELGLDGWLLFDFHDVNPLMRELIGVTGMQSRRLFVLLPRSGDPIALAHRIELDGLHGFSGEVRAYARWQELETGLQSMVAGRKLAMEVSPEDAIPYLDRVPLGVVQLLERLGATIVPSADLVARFGSPWTPDDVASHRQAAEACASIAASGFAMVQASLAAGRPVRETDVQAHILSEFSTRGFDTESRPIVGFGPNSANPHYEPKVGSDAVAEADQVVLIDLWCKLPGGSFADQTWMAYTGTPPSRVTRVWTAVRDARDAVIQALNDRFTRGEPIRGGELDDVARGVLEEAGLGDAFVHRTGHSIHHELHGTGPHLDNYETKDLRLIAPVCGFSVEPGAYLPGDFGVRSEVNVVMLPEGPLVTPEPRQFDLIVLQGS